MRMAVAAIGIVLLSACGDDGGPVRDAGADAGGRDAGDAGDASRRPDAGPACEAYREALEALVEASGTYDDVPRTEEVRRAAARRWVLERSHRHAERSIEQLEMALADGEHPLHDTEHGEEVYGEEIARHRADLERLEDALDELEATAPDDAVRTSEGARRVLDAVYWETIGDEALSLLARCRDEPADEDVVVFFGSTSRLVGDLGDDGGHGVARSMLATRLLGAEAP